MKKLKEIVESLARKINAPDYVLPTYIKSEGFARPHIEKHGSEYHWVVVERGQEFERRKTTDLKELLFWIFDSVTFAMATKKSRK
ncbi:Imm63 family immunity protein [Pontibacter beigongshangensis]|uniref:Imm63 family immunity protein n=1 Tax=Pontibacter beigongshangensis TaxID=2574733 RepID=UPI0016507340|nr:Imm63 family immunity protein [Pontibacter beigongshangensis]